MANKKISTNKKSTASKKKNTNARSKSAPVQTNQGMNNEDVIRITGIVIFVTATQSSTIPITSKIITDITTEYLSAVFSLIPRIMPTQNTAPITEHPAVGTAKNTIKPIMIACKICGTGLSFFSINEQVTISRAPVKSIQMPSPTRFSL